jgi:hypothetical protein
MSETATAHPPGAFPWTSLLRWQPFQIDALGLITLLGAEEVNASVGRMVRSTWLEYLPLLGAYVIANERFREKEAGYNIYNISQGIHTTDLASWFSRWIKAQDFEQTRSFIRWTVEKRPEQIVHKAAGFSLSIVSIGFLIAMTVLSYDWYGFANAMSMAASVMVRHFMVESLRQGIDEKVLGLSEFKTFQARDQQGATIPPTIESGWIGKCPSKIVVITADAKAVTMIVPNELLKQPSPFIARIEPEHRFFYGVMRWTGWIAFGVQVIAIGMADLATQLITVFLLVVPTVLHVSRLGCDDSQWKKNIARGYMKCTRILSSSPKDARGVHERSKSDVEKAKSLSPPGAPEVEHPRDKQFMWKYNCWIGDYLKAEVYEWPPNHSYTVTTTSNPVGDGQHFKVASVKHNGASIQKRQHLYAWLQLDADEAVSMDKWDLFPHLRGADKSWLDQYNAGKDFIAELNARGAVQQGIATIMNRSDTGAVGRPPTSHSVRHGGTPDLIRTGSALSVLTQGASHDPAIGANSPERRDFLAVVDDGESRDDAGDAGAFAPPRRQNTHASTATATYVSQDAVDRQRRRSEASSPVNSRAA